MVGTSMFATENPLTFANHLTFNHPLTFARLLPLDNSPPSTSSLPAMFTYFIAQYHPTGVKFCTLELPVGGRYLSENRWYKK